MNRNEIDAEIKQFEPTIKFNGKEFWAWRFLLTAPNIGPFKESSTRMNIQKFEKFWKTGKKSSHTTMIQRGFSNNIWFQDKKQYLNGDIYSDVVGLALGCNVLLGYVKCEKGRPTTTAEPKGVK